MIIAENAFAESVKSYFVRLFLLRIDIENSDISACDIKTSDRRNVRDVECPEECALVEVGDDKAVALCFKIIEPVLKLFYYLFFLNLNFSEPQPFLPFYTLIPYASRLLFTISPSRGSGRPRFPLSPFSLILSFQFPVLTLSRISIWLIGTCLPVCFSLMAFTTETTVATEHDASWYCFTWCFKSAALRELPPVLMGSEIYSASRRPKAPVP